MAAAAVAVVLVLIGVVVFVNTRSDDKKKGKPKVAPVDVAAEVRLEPEAPTATTPTSAAAPVTTAAPATTTPPPTAPPGPFPSGPPNADAAADGSVDGSSSLADSGPGLAIDGDLATSWFSGANDADGTTRFTWTGTREEAVAIIRVWGNEKHQQAERRRNVGFGSLTVQVLGSAGDVRFEQTVTLKGTPDPLVDVRPRVRGTTIRLIYRDRETPTIAGFSELQIGVIR